jgi:hypothetical protein
MRRPKSLPVKNKTPLTAREKKFVKKVLEYEQIGKAALAAGYANREYGSALLKREHIRQAVLEAMDKVGINSGYIAQKLKEGLEATYPKKYSSKGKVVQENEPDFFTRGQYLDKALKVSGAYDTETKEVHTQRELVLVITPELAKGLVDAEIIDVEEIKMLPEQKESKDGKKVDTRSNTE